MKCRYKEYDPVIYPRKIFVCSGGKKYVDEHFSNIDGTEISVDYKDCDGWAHKVLCKDTNNYGVLIWIASDLKPWDICHEVIHAINAYVHSLGTRIPSYVDEDYEEFAAYLGGWIFKCIWEFRYGKV